MFLLAAARPALGLERYAYVTEWGVRDVSPGNFNFARGITTDAEGNVYVADSGNNRIQKFTSTGVLLAVWGSSGSGPGQFNYPAAVAVDSNAVYVADENNHRIQKFTRTGSYLSQWGHQDTGDGNFEYPEGVTSDGVYVYTAEPSCCAPNMTNRIQKFTSGGGYVSKWSGAYDPVDVVADNAGHIFTMEDYRVVKYSNVGTTLGTIGFGQIGGSQGIDVDKFGNVFVADANNNRIEKFAPDGHLLAQWGVLGAGPGQFNYPIDVAVDDSGNVYVSDFSNYRIQKFAPGQTPVLLVHGICGNASSWDAFAQVLTDSGFVVDRLQYGSPNYSLRPAAYAGVLAAKLDEMGYPHVAVVAHSMGGLITREYMRRQIASGRPNKVLQLVTLGTPHHGSDLLAKILGWGPAVDGLIGAIFGPCLSSPFSKPALLDLVPGAWYLNRLNYGTQVSLNDLSTSHGWSPHQAETTLPGTVYFASIGGTGSFCSDNVRKVMWNGGAAYHPNDCTVATGGSLLAKTSVFRAADPDLALEKPAAHTNRGTTPCGEAYYSFNTLASRVATILLTSPTSPPVSLASEQGYPQGPEVLLSVEDSLQMAPAISDSVPSGQTVDKVISIPATSLARFTLLSSDAHVSLLRPDGTVITISDTSTAGGISFFATSDLGLEGFEIVAPTPGTWTMRINATASLAEQRIAGIVEYASAAAVQLSVLSTPLYTGDLIRVRGEVASGGVLGTEVNWTCNILGPDGVTSPLVLYDDGAHGDSLDGDGIYGNSASPAGGVGQYTLTASATAPGIGPLAAVAYCELADSQDLAVHTSDIQLSKNLPQAGDSITVSATVQNNSSTAAVGVPVEIRDLRADTVLGMSTVDIAAGSAVTVHASWVPAAPDTHEIQVQVSPYVLDESDFANNAASRVIVLGTPVSVDFGTVPLRLHFDPPFPNPTSRGVLFTFGLPRKSSAVLDIYDVIGRRVRSWRWTDLSPGGHSFEWDGNGTSGERLATGIYLCRLEVNGERLHRKIVLRR
jgi:pimeloyl-ACP methyl ester carboxylesterase